MAKKNLFAALVLACGIVTASAQVAPSIGSDNGRALTLGAEFSGFQTDTGLHQWQYGIGAYLDFDFARYIGLEIQGRTLSIGQQQSPIGNVREDTISGGYRFAYPYKRMIPYAKGLIGIGSADFPSTLPNYHHDTFTVFTIGAGTDYKLSHRVYLRGEFEYQFWPNFPFERKTLNPYGFSGGVSYRIF